MAFKLRFRDGTYWQARNAAGFKGNAWIMGILNFTSDSFFKPSRVQGIVEDEKNPSPDFLTALDKVKQADILDLGAESSRPGAQAVPASYEISVLLPTIKWLKKKYPHIRISVDTYKSEVARACIEMGADMINDISAGQESKDEMLKVAAQLKTPLILMHKQGIPATMQENPHYENVVTEVSDYLMERVNTAREYGCTYDRLIVDIGIGFGKTFKHNIALLNALPAFRARFNKIGVGILVGASRKSIVGDLTGKSVEDRLAGTIGLHLGAVVKGADIVRVHDVEETCDTFKGFFAVTDSLIKRK